MPTSILHRGDAHQYDLDAVEAGEWVEIGSLFSASVMGAFNATIIIEMSFDKGATAIPLTESDGSTKFFTAPERIDIEEVEDGVYYRFRCTAHVGGVATCRFGR
jgi:c-di-GMP-binding flagellar brake protein YcgR